MSNHRIAIIDYIKFNSEEPLRKVENNNGKIGNFKFSYKDDMMLVMWGHNKTERYSYVMAGTQCEVWRAEFGGDREFLHFINSMQPVVTRLDIALNTSGITVQEFWENHASRGVGALAQQAVVKCIASKKSGAETVYIGDRKKRAKKGVFRCYNYSLAHGLSDHVTRFELELGRSNANGAFNRIVAGSGLGATVRAYLDFPDCEEFQKCTDDGILIEPTRGKNIEENELMKMASRVNWLIEQCAPTLGRVMAREAVRFGSHPTYHEFLDVAKIAYYDMLSQLLIDSEEH